MNAFKVSERVDGDSLHLSLSGMIDEDSAFPEIQGAKFREVHIDLKEVSAINSIGIREWMDWLRPLSESSSVHLWNCTKPLVFQFNMVEGFLPAKARVRSFFVPHFCEKCDQEANVLVNVERELSVQNERVEIHVNAAEAVSCRQKPCGLEMDISEAKYFQFLKRSSGQ